MAETSQISKIRLSYPEQVDQKDFVNESWLLSRVTWHANLEVYAFFTPGLRKDESLGRVFSDLERKSDESFELEVAIELPAYLPNLSGKLQYVLPVQDEEGATQQVVVSNQMSRATFCKSNETWHALVPRHRREDTSELGLEEPIAWELLHTFVAYRSNAIGPDADAALEDYLECAIRKLCGLITQIVSSLIKNAPNKAHGHIPVYEPLMFPFAYIGMRGRDPDLVRSGRIAVNARRAAINPEDLVHCPTNKDL